MKTFIVDAFTDRPFAGNPAGVCLSDRPLAAVSMLQIAQELGYSETAFVTPLDRPASSSIRFFSPRMEIPLCGHATLASAKVMFEEQRCTRHRFVTIQNIDLIASGKDGQITMAFPVYDTQPAEAPDALLRALGIREVCNVAHNRETRILLVEIADTEVLSGLTPDFAALCAAHDSINGVLVTAPSQDGDYDFHSRYFWPWSGTNEDPVTGGTHTFLAKYWSERLGKSSMRSFQSSGRTGFMAVELRGDRVLITSQAHIVFRGELGVAMT